MSFCSPKNDNGLFTCFSDKSLITIATTWNKMNNSNPINIDYPIPLSETNKLSLWKNIHNRVKNYIPCKKEHCWMDYPLIKNIKHDELHDTFIPKKPVSWYTNKTTWLNTTDIANVLNQYANKHDDFTFIGPVPIDFDTKLDFGICVVEELCNINISKLYHKGMRRLGIVFNLDPHNMPGSHWVCMYLDIKTGGIYFIDSVGKKPVYHIQKLIKKLIKQCNHLILHKKINYFDLKSNHQLVLPIEIINDTKIRLEAPNKIINRLHTGMVLNFTKWNIKKNKYKKCKKDTIPIRIKSIHNNIITSDIPMDTEYLKQFGYNIGIIRGFRSFYNDMIHQDNNTECGVYCIYFITNLLQNIPFYKLVSSLKKDDAMEKLRDVFYRPSITKD
jgi:hypothetical protein